MTATRILYALVAGSCLLALLMATQPSLLTGLPDGPRPTVGAASPAPEQTVFLATRIRARAEVIRLLLRREVTFAEAVEAFARLNETPAYLKKQHGWVSMPASQNPAELRRQVLLGAREFAAEVEGSEAVLKELEQQWGAAGPDDLCTP